MSTNSSDHDNWLQCHRCGLIVAKVHTKRENEIVSIKDISNSSIYDNDKTIIKIVNQDKYSSKRRKQYIKNLKRPDHRNNNLQDKDGDLKSY